MVFIKISTLVKVASFIFSGLALVAFTSIFFLFNAIQQERIAYSNQIEFKQLGIDLKEASDFLTNMAREYVQEGDKQYYDAYMNEVNVVKTRPYVVARLKELNAPQSELDLVQSAADLSNTLAELETLAFECVERNELEEARNLMFGPDYQAGKVPIVETMENFQNTMNERASNEAATAKATSSLMLVIVIICLSVMVVLTLACFILLARKIKPIDKLVLASIDIANGNLNVNIQKGSTDEIGVLANSFDKVVTSLKMLIDDLHKMSREQDTGDFESFIDSNKYKASYKEVTTEVNNMVSGYVSIIREVHAIIHGFENGDFNITIKKYSKDKALAYDTMLTLEGLRDELKGINSAIYMQVESAVHGRLSDRLDESKFSGDWVKIMKGFNDVLDAVVEPIQEEIDVLTKVSKGNFDIMMNGNYEGDFIQIKTALNNTITNIASYIKEITYVLNEIANNNLNTEIKRDYIGQFSEIKDSLNKITNKLNLFMRDINSASEQVSHGAKQISQSATQLAEGSTEQASSVEELITTVNLMDTLTSQNANNAKSANELSSKSKNNALDGNNKMRDMLLSMEGIKKSSDSIHNIIKVIEDISFQTNLLALNASVEAARAGEHGKGFAVVAEEVRNLASRSQNAAKETNEMVQKSIQNVNEGTMLAKSTADALEVIVSNIDEVSRTVEQISMSSNEQSNVVSQALLSINQISNVVQGNSAMSEESAASAEELSSQSAVLKEMVSVFKTR